MTKNQRIVVEWLINSELNYMDNLHELEGSFDESETIPEEVREAYDGFTDVQKLEVVKKSASDLLKKLHS